jgi:hypothetical protein
MKFCCQENHWDLPIKNHFIVHIGFGPDMSRPLRDCVCGRELVSLRVIFSVGEILSFSKIELGGKGLFNFWPALEL